MVSDNHPQETQEGEMIQAHIPIEKVTTPNPVPPPKRKLRCEACKYFQSIALANDATNQGQCHRHAPRPCTTDNWSMVKGATDWCGDFA